MPYLQASNYFSTFAMHYEFLHLVENANRAAEATVDK